jgi:hypothetical protein
MLTFLGSAGYSPFQSEQCAQLRWRLHVASRPSPAAAPSRTQPLRSTAATLGLGRDLGVGGDAGHRREPTAVDRERERADAERRRG